MKAAVITFPGSNCDEDCVYALTKQGEFEVQRIWHKDVPDLTSFDLIVLPGGFSYGDYLRCGAMAALSPVVESVRTAAEAGKLVLGICNGFQILCEMHLLPGALVRNQQQLFVCKDVSLKVEASSPWSNQFKAEEVIQLPIAHGDGRYVVSPEEAEELRKNGQVILSYSSSAGKLDEESNPNGSVSSIAGVCNTQKNVFGLMPHPERASDLKTRDGARIWKSIQHFLNAGGSPGV